MKLAIFIALFGASMSGAQFYGVSLNKIVLVPLLAALLFNFLFENREFKIRIKGVEKKILGLYILAIFSCIYGMFSSYTDFFEYSNRIIAYAMQSIIFYIPIVLLLCSDKKRFRYYDYFMKSLIWVCRIQGVWALIQFVLYYSLKLNFNEMIFNDILKGIINFEGGIVRYSYENGTLALRIAGLNSDPAYLCILLVIGFVFEKNKIFKYLYVGIMMLTLSRVGIIVILCLIAWDTIKKIQLSKIKVKFKKIIIFFVSIVGVCFIAVYLYNTVPYVKHQIDYFSFRLGNIFETGTGKTQSSTRHILYLSYSFVAYFTELDLVQKFIGVGMRVTTAVFAGNISMAENLQFTGGLLNTALATECDIAEMLLGGGIIGFWLYYSFLYKAFRYGEGKVALGALAIFIYGFMYDVSTITFIQILFWFMCINIEESIMKKNEKVEEKTQSIGEQQAYDVYNNA